MDRKESGDSTPEFYIQTSSSLLEQQLRSLKQGDTFAMFDDRGDICSGPGGPEGLYHKDTRFLSFLKLEVQGRRPLLLSSFVQRSNACLTVDLTNPDIHAGETLLLPRDCLHVLRSKFLWDGICHERIVVRNYGMEDQDVVIRLSFKADFLDVFEVRGHSRPRRGHIVRSVTGRDRVVLQYHGLDHHARSTTLCFQPHPRHLDDHHAEWRFRLSAGDRTTLTTAAACNVHSGKEFDFRTDLRKARHARTAISRGRLEVRTSSQEFNDLLAQSLCDLDMLAMPTAHGHYPYAGIPWYSTAFGRDGIITAIEMLAFDPAMAKAVLHFLANRQAEDMDAANDAEPGKILHETRQGEMANLREVPFGRYYGSVDSTPLFVLLAGLYWKRSGDVATLRELWPRIRAAIRWMDESGDLDGDGLVEYLRRSANGLSNQGWKDSEDSVIHADGTLARGSIALCEVQGYVYAAKVLAAQVATALGDGPLGNELVAGAKNLRARFEALFWMEEPGFYALALDGDKRACRVMASNAGHLLFCGMVSPGRARKVAGHLLSRNLFSGWGIRTLAESELRYNPMSYHNGSVWPHDNALIALGLARYGHTGESIRILQALFDASQHMKLNSLPELFCGFQRKSGRNPTSYPVACSPQAWASAAPFALLTAALGLEIDAVADKVVLNNPQLPAFIDEVEIRHISLPSGSGDLRVRRSAEGLSIDLESRRGRLRVQRN